ncbi:ferritin-like domain-containing protein [Flavobacterium pectinovorum]|uniref:Ferritin-like domain-containing protein n=1 Tax=Flavobacterium pectinovorum TaxID=29533 RepID=A0A502EBP2_9FLAO|nr:ferritin-like domain-containing protein [Flavobacterium pectinovorum]TPG33916.1 ferritin-like domain-containing protein [Flavobacterium pectinovorum]
MKNSEKQPTANKATTNTKNLVVAPAKDAAEELYDFFIDSLKDIYWAENALLEALAKMAANATSPSLSSTIIEHRAVTENQIVRLQKVFNVLGENAEGKKCEAMAGLLKEGDAILQETVPGAVRDAGIISASQKIEHYEIATYGTLAAFAKTLGENEVAKLLTQTLSEEKEADCLLNDIALNTINIVAAE